MTAEKEDMTLERLRCRSSRPMKPARGRPEAVDVRGKAPVQPGEAGGCCHSDCGDERSAQYELKKRPGYHVCGQRRCGGGVTQTGQEVTAIVADNFMKKRQASQS